jgi:hypothetical protein
MAHSSDLKHHFNLFSRLVSPGLRESRPLDTGSTRTGSWFLTRHMVVREIFTIHGRVLEGFGESA